jgi:hypothetical protein
MKKTIRILTLSLFSLLPFCKMEALVNNGQGSLSVQGELLYFKAVTDQTAFITTTPVVIDFETTVTTEDRITNDPSFRPGFRLEADWTACDCLNQMQLRYVNLYNGHQKTVTGLLTPVLSSPIVAMSSTGTLGTAFSKIGINYNAGDAVWGRTLFNHTDFDLSFLIGLHVASSRYKENIEIQIPDMVAVGNWRSQFWGIGPEVGLNAHYALPYLCNLSFVGDLRGALLAGRRTAQFTETATGSGTLTFRNRPSNWGAVPAFDGKLGLNYFLNIFCFCTSFEIGYEMIWYPNVVDKIYFQSDASVIGASTASYDTQSDLSLHGPYAAIRISF